MSTVTKLTPSTAPAQEISQGKSNPLSDRVKTACDPVFYKEGLEPGKTSEEGYAPRPAAQPKDKPASALDHVYDLGLSIQYTKCSDRSEATLECTMTCDASCGQTCYCETTVGC